MGTQLRCTTRSTTVTSTTMVATTQCLNPQQVLGEGHQKHCTSEQLPQALQQSYLSIRRSSPSRHSLLGQLQVRQRNLDQKIKGLWIGKDPTTDKHLTALPPVYDNHPSVTGAIYKCRGVTRLPRPNMWDTTFLATIQWPSMESMDYIEPDVSENYKYLQEHNTSTREQLAQQPQQFQPVQEQPRQRAQRREVLQPNQPPVPQQEPLGATTEAIPLRPPPGLEHVRAQPPGLLGTTAKAPPIAPPPQPVRPQPVAGPPHHRPVGKHYNPVRQRPQPQQAGAVLPQPNVQQQADMDNGIDSYDCYNLTMETNVLHLAVNEDKRQKGASTTRRPYVGSCSTIT